MAYCRQDVFSDLESVCLDWLAGANGERPSDRAAMSRPRRELCKTFALMGATALIGGTKEAFAQTLLPRSAMALSSHDNVAGPLVARMTLAEKLGQMAQAELGNLADEADVENLFLGSVLSGGGADPSEGNGLSAWTDTVDGLIERSLGTRLGIPLLYGVDAVHGHSNVLGAVVFPHNVGLGCTRNPALVEEIGRVTALETRATGVRWTFAPCVAVPRDDRWGRTYEGFSEDPALVATLGAAAVHGLQWNDLSDPRAVLACAKHFVGDGGTTYGSAPRRSGPAGIDQGDTPVDEATLRRLHLPGYVSSIAAGVGSIMVSYSSWNGDKVTGSRYLLTDLLKNELGFEGIVISDYYAIGQVDRDYKTAVERSINAGVDMAMEPAGYARFIATLGELVEEGRVPLARIDDAVRRILRVKSALGLLDPTRPKLADRRLQEYFGAPAHRDVARRAVRESLVVLKNESVLPLAKRARRIVVAGPGADDIGMQCGGWTVEWQGRRGAVTTGGTTVLAAIRAAVDDGAEVVLSPDGTGTDGADAVVVVVGETPYAEGVGDRADPALSDDDRALVMRLEQSGGPLVVVVLSGRPLVLGDEVVAAAGALVAAWLPGTEGQGIADVLFGDFNPTGRLGRSWPRSSAQQPINIGDAEYDPLFAYGFGLSY